MQSFRGADDEAYAQIPETLATSPSSFTLGGTLDAALEYSSKKVTTDMRVRANYTRLDTEGNPNQETADDLRLSSSVSLPIARVPRSGFGLMPYAEVLYDTEFTPIEDDTGEPSLRQADLSGTLGLSASPWRSLRALRVGAFANRDMARWDDKPTEFGGRIEVSTRVILGPSVRFTTDWDGSVYADTAEDDASDLRFRLLADAALGLPLARWLDISVYAQGFLFQGRVPETQRVGFASTLGFSLDVSSIFEL